MILLFTFKYLELLLIFLFLLKNFLLSKIESKSDESFNYIKYYLLLNHFRSQVYVSFLVNYLIFFIIL